MDADQMQAVRELIEFARNVSYNDTRYPPKDINEAARIAETYLDGDQNESTDETLPQ